jgi:spermidine synthase
VALIGYYVMRTVGVRNTAYLLTLTAFVVSAVVGRASRVLLGVNVIAAILTLSLMLGTGSVPMIVHSVLYRQLGDPRILFYREDQHASVSVLDMNGARALMVNTLMESRLKSDDFDDIGGLSDIAVASHPSPGNLFVAGLGGGKTAGVAALYPALEVDTVEISPSVISALPLFNDFTYEASQNPRLNIIEGDARHFLQLTARRYDLIVADVFTSAVTGTSYLYNREFFALCRDRLQPGGRVVIQVDLHGSQAFYRKIDRVVARTFVSAMPDAKMVRIPTNGNTYLIGAAEAIVLPARHAVLNSTDPQLLERWTHLGLQEGISGMQILDKGALERELADVPISTDNLPVIDSVQMQSPDRALTW